MLLHILDFYCLTPSLKCNRLATSPDVDHCLAQNKGQQIFVELNFMLSEASPVDQGVFADGTTEYRQVNQ